MGRIKHRTTRETCFFIPPGESSDPEIRDTNPALRNFCPPIIHPTAIHTLRYGPRIMKAARWAFPASWVDLHAAGRKGRGRRARAGRGAAAGDPGQAAAGPGAGGAAHF